LLNSAIWYTIGTFILKGVNFFTTPIFTNLLDTNEFGVTTIYSTWSAIFAIIIGIGINGTVGSAKANLNEKDYEEYLSSTLFLATISFFVIGIASLIFRHPLEGLLGLSVPIIIVLLFESFFSFVISFTTSVFTFERNHKAYLFTSAITTLINVTLSIILILSMNSDKYAGRIYGGAIAVVSVGIILYIKVMRRGKKLVSLDHWKFCLPIALPLIFHNLSHLILNQADKLMLQKVTTEAVVGIYGFTYTIGALINTIQLALNSAWVPWYYDTLKSGNKKEMKKVSAIYIAVFTALTIMFILGSPDILRLFSPKEYWSGMNLLPIIIAGYYFVFLYTFPANYQFYIKQTKFIAVGTITAAIINIVINWLFIPEYGMYAAAMSTLCAYIVLFFMHFILVKVKYKHTDFPFTFNLIGIGAVAIASFITYIFINNFFVRWGIIFIILGIAAYMVIKNIKEFDINKK
ncbi:oligosaccharide flippase family protein, partial [Clostridium saudiense]|nr:oligosaccharide flippase family protein [Clostridium saudiense]